MAEGETERSVLKTSLPLFSAEEVQQHNTEKDAWVIHRGKVYDVSEFLERHPGGKDILLAYAGQDVTTLMTQEELHRHTTFAYGWLGKYLIGRLKGKVSKAFKCNANFTVSFRFFVFVLPVEGKFDKVRGCESSSQ